MAHAAPPALYPVQNRLLEAIMQMFEAEGRRGPGRAPDREDVRRSPEKINLLPQNANVNMGAWKAMEKQWQKLLKEQPPHVIEVDIHAVYGDASGRPTS